MKFTVVIFFQLVFISLLAYQSMVGQDTTAYFQQGVAYKIEAVLDTNHVVSATTEIVYQHNGKEALDTFFLHLWMNAFQDKLSDYSEQNIRLGQLDYYFSSQKQSGGYDGLNVFLGNQKVSLYSWEGNKDVVYFLLPEPIKSGDKVSITCNYNLQLPKKNGRTGYTRYEDYCMYWYPTPAVYDRSGWHPMPYLSMGETYQEIADFDVSITSPYNHTVSSYADKVKIVGDTRIYTAKNLIDFVWVGSHKKKIYTSSISRSASGPIKLSVLTRDSARFAACVEYFKKALPYFEKKIGQFPYSKLSIVDKGSESKGGMEYPGLITVSGDVGKQGSLEYYVVHEMLHQYFYAALAFNQRAEAWLDEGLTTYYQQRYYDEIYAVDYYSKIFAKLMSVDGQPFMHSACRGQAHRHYHRPLITDVQELDPVNYGFNSYEVPARMFSYLEEFLGRDFDLSMKSFYGDWSKKHPKSNDLQQCMEKQSKKNLSWFFDGLVGQDWSYDYSLNGLKEGELTIVHKTGSAPPYKITFYDDSGAEMSMWVEGHTGMKTINVDAKWTAAEIDKSKKSMDIDRNNNFANVKRPIRLVPLIKMDEGKFREVFFSPLLSFNTSDGAQLGMAFYNSTFPSKRFKWVVAPAYGFNSKSMVGEAWLSYDQYLGSHDFRKFQYKLSAKRYSFRFSEKLGKGLHYLRVNPTISLHMKHDTKESKYSKIYFKPIFINEEYFEFQKEEVFIHSKNSTVFRLGYEYYDFWKLGPSELNVQLEYQPYKNDLGEKHQYTKLTAAYSKSFNYAPTRSVDFRLWGSYFLMNTQRNSSSYNSAITRGASALIYQGFNDYAYDDYFFNRGNQGAKLSNQVSHSGGGFKVPLGTQYDLGQTNDLAFALNIKSDLPIKMPKILPLKLFLDIGYFTSKATEVSDKVGSTIYSGGVMLEYGEGLFSIHLPLFNSQSIEDIYEVESTKWTGKISFKIDLIRFNPWDIVEDYTY